MTGAPRMDDLDVEVTQLPAEFGAWEAEPEQMAAGAPGKVGLLQLEFGRRNDRTRLVRTYSTGPQQVRRALYIDPLIPDMAFAMVQSVSGGVLQGDRLGTRIHVDQGARAHVTTQAATKIYKMDRNYATSRLTLTVESGAYCEYLPDWVIPQRSARFYQETHANVGPGGVLVLGDLLAPGRVGFGETFDFELVCTRLRVRDLEGALRFSDYVHLQPRAHPPARPGLLGQHDYYGALLVMTNTVPAEHLVSSLYEGLDGAGALGGASSLPHGDGAIMRAVGHSAAETESAIRGAWSSVRTLLLGAPAPPISRIKYGFEPTVPSRPIEPKVVTANVRL